MGDWPSEEADLRPPVRAYLEARGYTVRDEVWINGRIADLYAYEDGDEPVAVELKLTNWKKALRQAVAYQLGAVHTYIALPVVHVAKILRQASALRSRNVGLLGVAPPAGGGFERADELDPGEAPDEGEADVRELVEPGDADRFLPFLASKIVEDAERPKQRPTNVPKRRGW